MREDIWSYLCYLIAFAVYLNTLTAEFVYDDRRAILSNEDVNSDKPLVGLWINDFWGTPLASTNSHGSYRPLCVLSFRLNHWMFGYQPWAYHVTNVVFHTLATALVLKLGKVLLSARAAYFGALIFSVHPIHTEAVAGVVGRADVIACIFYLLSLLSYIHHCKQQDPDPTNDIHNLTKFKKHLKRFDKPFCTNNCEVPTSNRVNLPFLFLDPIKRNVFLVLTIFFASIATFSKETGFTVLPTCIIYELLLLSSKPRRTQKKISPWRNLEILLLSSLILFVIRIKLSDFHVPTFSTADNPIPKSDFITRFFTFLYLPVFNFQLFVFPYRLSFDWGMESIPRINTIFDTRNMLSLVFYYCLHILAKTGYQKYQQCGRFNCDYKSNSIKRLRKRQKTLPTLIVPTFLLFSSIVTFLPASNLFFYVGFVVAERILYLPSVGLCLLIGYGYHVITSRMKNKRTSDFVFTLLMLALAIRCVLRNNDWQNEEKLYKSNVDINPPKAYGNLGSILSDEGRLEEAEVAFKSALKYRCNMADVHYNLAMLQEKTNRPDEAEASYNMAIRFRPTLAVAYLKLGQLLVKMNRTEEAKTLLKTCSQLSSNGLKDPKMHHIARMEALITLASIENQSRNYQNALSIYFNAILTAPQHYKPQALYNFIGETLIKMEKYEEAEKWFSCVTGEVELERQGFSYFCVFTNITNVKPQEWISLMKKHRTFTDPYIHLHYSQLLFDMKKYLKAAQILKKVINIKTNDYDLIRKTANICKLAGLLEESEKYYRKVTNLHPHASSYNDLGAILYLRGKVAESEIAYKHAYKLNPQDKTIEDILLKLNCILYNKNSSSESNKTVE